MRMHNNPLWLAFLLGIMLVTLWFCGAALYHFYQYKTLKAEVPAVISKWSIKALSDEEYLVHANYSYQINGKSYEGETDFNDEIYINSWAAQKRIEKFSEKPWNAWYQPSRPLHSTLQKKFPLKECLSAAAMLALLLYFIWLGYYVARTGNS